jgi:hypothetical protein
VQAHGMEETRCRRGRGSNEAGKGATNLCASKRSKAAVADHGGAVKGGRRLSKVARLNVLGNGRGDAGEGSGDHPWAAPPGLGHRR